MTFTAGPGTVRLTPSSPTGNPYVQWNTTWNNAGTTFTGIRFDVTDTASAAGSLLMDLRVGGVSQLSVRKDARIIGGTWAPNASFVNYYFGNYSNGWAWYDNGPNSAVAFNSNILSLRSIGVYGWSDNASSAVTTIDLQLFRDAADTLAQRRGVNAQTFRIYGTFTDASNYVRSEITSSTFYQRAAGSGLTNEGSFEIGNLTGTTNLFFRVNNGTRVWYFGGATGHFLANLDNTYDIGASGANRPKNAFLGGYLQLPNGSSGNTSVRFDSANGIYRGATDGLTAVIIETAANGGFAVLQTGGSPSAPIGVKVCNTIYFGTALNVNSDTSITRVAANILGASGALQLSEMTAPAAPAANNVVIYAEDNGSGKTRLMARFATGAAQQIAIEP